MQYRGGGAFWALWAFIPFLLFIFFFYLSFFSYLQNIAKEVSLYYKLLRGLSGLLLQSLTCLMVIVLYSCMYSFIVHSFCAANDAKCWFIKLWSSSHLFGMEFFSCINTEIKEKGLVGISKEKVREH